MDELITSYNLEWSQPVCQQEVDEKLVNSIISEDNRSIVSEDRIIIVSEEEV